MPGASPERIMTKAELTLIQVFFFNSHYVQGDLTLLLYGHVTIKKLL